MPFVLASITFLLVILLILVGYKHWQGSRRLEQRLSLYGTGKSQDGVVKHSFVKVGVLRLTRLTNRGIPRVIRTNLRQQLVMAGSPGNLQPSEFFLLKSGICLFILTIGLVLRLSFLSVALFNIVAWLIPDLYLRYLIIKRQLAIALSIPDMLDLLTVSVEAGLGFDSAVAKVVEKQTGPLAEELRRMLYEIRVGRPRREALRNLSTRTGADYLQSFVAAVIQGDQLGVSISKILRIQSSEIRRQRRQKAEEAAMKAPIKMLLPLIGLVFPTIFIVLLGPALISFITNL